MSIKYTFSIDYLLNGGAPETIISIKNSKGESTIIRSANLEADVDAGMAIVEFFRYDEKKCMALEQKFAEALLHPSIVNLTSSFEQTYNFSPEVAQTYHFDWAISKDKGSLIEKIHITDLEGRPILDIEGYSHSALPKDLAINNNVHDVGEMIQYIQFADEVTYHPNDEQVDYIHVSKHTIATDNQVITAIIEDLESLNMSFDHFSEAFNSNYHGNIHLEFSL